MDSKFYPLSYVMITMGQSLRLSYYFHDPYMTPQLGPKYPCA